MKRFGISAFDDHGRDNRNVGITLGRQNQELNDQLKAFQDRLIDFAREHNSELRAHPEFRLKFVKMCSSIGIDPISLFDKDRHLFHVDDFYYEICVKVIEICRRTKDLNGGIISFNELHKGFFKETQVQLEDIEKAISMLSCLEGGLETFVIRGKKYLQSVPNELTGDQTKILELCSILGYVSISLLQANLQWKAIRSKAVLEKMVAKGLLWVDDQDGPELLYWDPAWSLNNK